MIKRFFGVVAMMIVLAANSLRADEPLLITGAHAHNDYVHTHPLFDALTNGFCSVEADIYLTNGQLLVAHTLEKTHPGRTLQSLYLDRLRARVRHNGGSVYTNGPEFTLLIELKQDWQDEYPTLRAVLTNYADVLVSYHTVTSQTSAGQWVTNEVELTNAIIVIITGHNSPKMFAGETVRYAALDGSLSDLDSNPPATLVPWISENWKANFKWNGKGTMPEVERQKLEAIVTRAHEQGRRVRFWGSPDNLNFWKTMRAAGVDLINTDNLPGVANFFRLQNG